MNYVRGLLKRPRKTQSNNIRKHNLCMWYCVCPTTMFVKYKKRKDIEFLLFTKKHNY